MSETDISTAAVQAHAKRLRDHGHSGKGGILPVTLALLADRDRLAAEVARLKSDVESTQRGRDCWRDDFKALSAAIVGETGLSAMTVAAQAKLYKPRAVAAEAEVARLREALAYYRDTCCEGFCEEFPAGFTNREVERDCSGCKARAILTAHAARREGEA